MNKMQDEIRDTIKGVLDTYDNDETVGKLKEDIDVMTEEIWETVSERLARFIKS